MTSQNYLFIVTLMFVVLMAVAGFQISCHYFEEPMPVKEVCETIDQLPPGDAQAFLDWIGPQKPHVITYASVAACLFARLPYND